MNRKNIHIGKGIGLVFTEQFIKIQFVRHTNNLINLFFEWTGNNFASPEDHEYNSAKRRHLVYTGWCKARQVQFSRRRFAKTTLNLVVVGRFVQAASDLTFLSPTNSTKGVPRPIFGFMFCLPFVDGIVSFFHGQKSLLDKP